MTTAEEVESLNLKIGAVFAKPGEDRFDLGGNKELIFRSAEQIGKILPDKAQAAIKEVLGLLPRRLVANQSVFIIQEDGTADYWGHVSVWPKVDDDSEYYE